MKTIVETYDRWRDFALRMAHTCWTNRNRPSRDWIVEQVQEVFGLLIVEDMPCYANWDHSNPYPEGHASYCRTYRRPCWDCQGQGCDKSYCEDGHVYEYATPLCISDQMSEWEDEWWYSIASLATKAEYRRWERLSEVGRVDEAEELHRKIIDHWTSPVICCVRAGMDCAIAPSAGVMGFTAGDLRRMYPEGVPGWVTGDEPWKTIEVAGVIPGVGFVPRETDEATAFSDLPDDATVWL